MGQSVFSKHVEIEVDRIWNSSLTPSTLRIKEVCVQYHLVKKDLICLYKHYCQYEVENNLFLYLIRINPKLPLFFFSFLFEQFKINNYIVNPSSLSFSSSSSPPSTFIKCEFSIFVEFISTFCFWSKEQVLHFLFTKWDKENTGFIEQKCLFQLGKQNTTYDIKEKNSKEELDYYNLSEWNEIQIQQIEKIMEKYKLHRKSTLLNFETMKVIHSVLPQLLWPVFKFQLQLRQVTLGVKRWKHLIEEDRKEKNLQGKVSFITNERPYCFLCCCLPRLKIEITSNLNQVLSSPSTSSSSISSSTTTTATILSPKVSKRKRSRSSNKYSSFPPAATTTTSSSSSDKPYKITRVKTIPLKSRTSLNVIDEKSEVILL